MQYNYKIIWIDDDCNNYVGEAIIEMFEVFGLEVVKAFTNRNEALQYIKTTIDPFDALILDARCPDEKDGVLNWESLLNFIVEIRQKFPEMPYAIFTGQADLMDNTSFNNIFNGKVFHKGGNEEEMLVDYICSQIDAMPRNQIRLMYDDVFEALAVLDAPQEHCDSLLNILFAHHKPELAGAFNPFDQYNTLRRILEVVFRALARVEILPSQAMIDYYGNININQCSCFLEGKPAEKARAISLLRNGPAPKYIANIIRFTLDMTTIHSHTNDSNMPDRNKENFYRSGNSKRLIFGITINLCEVIQWAADIIVANPDPNTNRMNYAVGDRYDDIMRTVD